eukprot:TRINITY_DN3949_c0_g1_i1.p1 TRINITY_DN3949_c0_g1~~TRINITY_DN3949_c0_g1_i1.p1  ORF type:complete len:267 (-),score=19.25 TRINITY_DN3949_c0_g1_i1:41-841(-)
MARAFLLSVLLLVVVSFLALCDAQRQESIVISSVGTFLQNDVYGLGNCSYCNCLSGYPCAWVDDFTCANNAAKGPDDNQERWGSCPSQFNCSCFDASGVGFQGVSQETVLTNTLFGVPVGIITHYNNIIGRDTSPSALRITLAITSPAFGPNPVVIDTRLNFNETTNWPTVAQCDPRIQRSNVPCDDRFTFADISQQISFSYDGVAYTMGFSGFVLQQGVTPVLTLTTTEGLTTSAYIYVYINAVYPSECPLPSPSPSRVPQCKAK